MADDRKLLLHLGCGGADAPPERFPPADYKEVRADLDPDLKGVVLADIRDIPFADDSFAAIYASHVLEHVHEHEVLKSLRECSRVLRPDGELVLVVPDIRPAAAAVAEDRALDPLYESPAGPIRPVDMLYGHQPSIARGQVLMAHCFGFTPMVLGTALHNAGFNAEIFQATEFDLWAEARKP